MKSTTRSLMLLLAVCLVLASCASYERSVKKDLRIPYVYIPPNDANHPFTLFHYTREGNFQPACPATLLTGMTEEEIRARRKENRSASFGITRTYKTEFEITLSEKELGEFAGKYKSIRKMEISFENGKVYTLPDVFVSDAVERIKTTKCAAEVKLLYAEMPDSRFFMPLVVYGYDLRYHIYSENGAEVTAELPEALIQVILAKVGLKYESSADVKVAGDGMYVGFRGTPLQASLESLREDSKEKGFTITGAPEGGQKTVHLLDVTDMVEQISKGR